MFTKGKHYTRNEISKVVGGGLQDCLPHVGNRVVAVCMKKDMNPQAPHVMLVGKGRDKERYSEILCSIQQNETVPVFTKKDTNAWEFEGFFSARQHSKEPRVIVDNEKTSGRSEIYMIIYFQEM